MRLQPTRSRRPQLGRSKIVEGMRQAMRSSVDRFPSRRQIADAAGVTPPLVGYYFESIDDLVEAAASPIMKEHLEMLKCIRNTDTSVVTKARKAVHALITLFQNDRHLAISYIYLCERGANKSENYYVSIRKILRDIILNWLNDGYPRINDAEFAEFFVWTICQGRQNGHDLPMSHGAVRFADNAFKCIFGGLFCQADDVLYAAQSCAARQSVEGAVGHPAAVPCPAGELCATDVLPQGSEHMTIVAGDASPPGPR